MTKVWKDDAKYYGRPPRQCTKGQPVQFFKVRNVKGSYYVSMFDVKHYEWSAWEFKGKCNYYHAGIDRRIRGDFDEYIQGWLEKFNKLERALLTGGAEEFYVLNKTYNGGHRLVRYSLLDYNSKEGNYLFITRIYEVNEAGLFFWREGNKVIRLEDNVVVGETYVKKCQDSLKVTYYLDDKFHRVLKDYNTDYSFNRYRFQVESGRWVTNWSDSEKITQITEEEADRYVALSLVN